VTVYVPGVLVDGIISPVVLFSVNPAGKALYVPPVKDPLPVKVTDCPVVMLAQNGPA
jgi:hypothetical protein